ncbi:hypothetical protein K469DRAFT_706094 [Zopfia rhizophila CBS 207.26]|uniref:Uncharacterized protein n=1 Tax=Zopfia rhizophila CBS 207.26 TaxID=1314779 RepID=A0A6A6EWX9_9PEZI|nr:hypothetical protein K469DRAFT_706094 [Zopfia rhizophila CBS 207.26]
MVGGYSGDEVGFYGSVVGADKERVTLALTYDNDTDTRYIARYDNTPKTITLAGSTYFESVATTTDSEERDMTVSLACSMTSGARARPTCTISTGGKAVYDMYCEERYSGYEDYTTTYRRTYTADEFGPATTQTYIRTYNYGSYIPSYCKSGSTLPASLAVSTVTLGRSVVQTYQAIITAGEEKLAATTGGVVSNNSAQPTGSNAVATGSGGTSSPTGTAAAAAAGTGAAAPMMTPAAALAGAAVAMAALVL